MRKKSQMNKKKTRKSLKRDCSEKFAMKHKGENEENPNHNLIVFRFIYRIKNIPLKRTFPVCVFVFLYSIFYIAFHRISTCAF